MKRTTLIFPFLFLWLCGYVTGQTKDESFSDTWKAGVSRIDITPEQPMWMAGYGSRTSPSEGTLHPIWIKALALEDASGHQSVLVTADLLGWPKGLSDSVRKEAEEKFGLSKSQIILNSSHTHTGPVLADALLDIYPLEETDLAIIKKYTKTLGEKVIRLIGAALEEMEPAFLYAENGVARFQVNRRNNSESTLHRATELKGPNDHSVPVIKVASSEGDLKVIVFGYACHPTVLSLNQWSGDYAGFAQIELEKEYPGAVAMFFQGAGADNTLYLVFRLWQYDTVYFPDNYFAALAYMFKKPGEPWSEPQPLVIAPFSHYSVYYHRLTIDRKGRLFLSYDYWSTYWFYRNDRKNERSLLMSEDGGKHWKLVTEEDFQK